MTTWMQGEGSEKADDDVGNDEELVIGGSMSETSKTHVDLKHIVSSHTIDGFWVWRQISEVFPDASTAETKAKAALSILRSESSLRDCENQLMELFKYQNFHLITKFLKNRDIIAWCTKLIQSEVGDRVNVEVAMWEKGVGWILCELAGNRQKKKTHDNAMNVDKPVAVPKTATLAPGSTIQPKHAVDLESIAFSQGGHLMTNKKCKLFEGSFKRSRKGFEETHVPAPPRKPISDELVPIERLPEWARKAFTVPTLNRVQSKLLSVAFGTAEPILLCAPTSAGKVGNGNTRSPLRTDLIVFIDQRSNAHNSY